MTRPSLRKEIEQAIKRASRDPIARKRRELLENNEHLIITQEPPKAMSPVTTARLLVCGLRGTEGSGW